MSLTGTSPSFGTAITFLGLPVISTVILCFTSHAVADNAVLRSIFSCQAQGYSGLVPSIDVWYQQGTNLSFIPTGETIRKVWLNDPSQVTMDFDGQMCMQFGPERNTNLSDCKNSSAHVIQIRRIPRINIPGIPKVSNTLLTVITEGQGIKLYTFRVRYRDDVPEYNTLAIFPDPPSSNRLPCVKVSG
jgi:hypothetical protein